MQRHGPWCCHEEDERVWTLSPDVVFGRTFFQLLQQDVSVVLTRYSFIPIDGTLTHNQTTNFGLFKTERVCRRQFQIWRKWWKKIIQSGRKTRGKRRNCSLRAIYPFPTVFFFKKYCFPGASKGVIVWEWVNPLHHMPFFGSSNSAANKSMMSKIRINGVQLSDRVENIVGKGENARYEQFLLFPQCFQKLSIVDASKWVFME